MVIFRTHDAPRFFADSLSLSRFREKSSSAIQGARQSRAFRMKRCLRGVNERLKRHLTQAVPIVSRRTCPRSGWKWPANATPPAPLRHHRPANKIRACPGATHRQTGRSESARSRLDQLNPLYFQFSDRLSSFAGQNFQRLQGGDIAAFDPEFGIDVLKVFFYRAGADVEDHAGLEVRFALRHPQ